MIEQTNAHIHLNFTKFYEFADSKNIIQFSFHVSWWNLENYLCKKIKNSVHRRLNSYIFSCFVDNCWHVYKKHKTLECLFKGYFSENATLTFTKNGRLLENVVSTSVKHSKIKSPYIFSINFLYHMCKCLEIVGISSKQSLSLKTDKQHRIHIDFG